MIDDDKQKILTKSGVLDLLERKRSSESIEDCKKHLRNILEKDVPFIMDSSFSVSQKKFIVRFVRMNRPFLQRTEIRVGFRKRSIIYSDTDTCRVNAWDILVKNGWIRQSKNGRSRFAPAILGARHR